MKTKTLLLFLSFLATSSLWASIPTTEGLFRNNNNTDVQATLVMVTLQAEKKLNEKALEKPVEDSPLSEADVMKPEEQINKKVNLKYLFSVNEREDVEVVRVIYKPGKMDDDNIIDVKYYKNLEKGVVENTNRKGLVLGLLSSLALNRSEEISAFLKKVSTNYKSNEELIDPEKRDLYNQYKKYLKLIKEDESLKESLDNPMAPKDEEVRKTVEKIKERPFLQKDPHVSLEKKDASFLWKVDLDVLDAIFDGKTQRLQKLNFTKESDELAISLDDYILFNGNNELPKTIKMNTLSHTFILRTSSHVQLNLGSKSMWQRYNEYIQKLKSNGETESTDFFFL